MRTRNVVLLIAAAVLAVVGAVMYVLYERSISSPLNPEISFDKNDIYVTTAAKDSELLQGVTATDPEDGDVTDSVLVEGVSALIGGNTAKVTYVAFDSKNHIGRAQRLVHFTDYEAPEFYLSRPLIFRRSNTVDLLSCVSAQDMFDGDISHKVICNLVGTSASLAAVGTHDVELRVTNSMGDTSRLELQVEVTETDPNPMELRLKQYIVYISAGDEFVPADYFASYVSNEEVKTEITGVKVESTVDTQTPGVYTVTYSVGRNNDASKTRLVVVVK